MTYQKRKIYNTPLNNLQTVELPSNLLSHRPTIKQYQIVKTRIPKTIDLSSQQANDFLKKKRSQNVIIEDKEHQTPKKNVLYKRLNEIKQKNQTLQTYSYSKLLSKMVFSDTSKTQNQTLYHTIHPKTDFKSLKGRILDLQFDQLNPKINKHQIKSDKKEHQTMNKTARIFQRFYNPKNERINRYFLDHSLDLQQKYIYINGIKTQCKRIHNFYTSHHYRKSYDKSVNNSTKISFYTRKNDL